MVFAITFAAVLVIIVVINAMWGSLGFGSDDTDLYIGGRLAKRSGMTIVTDYGTGVQYLTTTRGGLTPRLDANGKVMVAKVGEQ